MTQQRPLSAISAGQSAAVLDNAPVAVYVCAADSRELLYVNKLAQGLLFSVPYREGLTCYEAAGFDRPCPFCRADRMNREGLVNRDFRHPVSGRVYRLSGRLIDWDGREAHIEYISDITKELIADKTLHRLTISSYDFVIDVDLSRDSFYILAGNPNIDFLPKGSRYSEQMEYMLQNAIVPRDREKYRKALDPEEVRRKLAKTASYTFSFSVTDEHGDIRTKNMTVSAVDLRIGRICLVRTDITESVREQQRLLNVFAYTFDLLAFISVDTGRLMLYTRQTVLENLPPFTVEQYGETSVKRLSEPYGLAGEKEATENQFRLETILKRLEERPAGYDFVAPYRAEDGLRYKQINVLWGDEMRRTVCMVRADVTDMLAAERETKEALKEALNRAEEASRAKSNFLSSMSMISARP